jgi:hypothetical protein
MGSGNKGSSIIWVNDQISMKEVKTLHDKGILFSVPSSNQLFNMTQFCFHFC